MVSTTAPRNTTTAASPNNTAMDPTLIDPFYETFSLEVQMIILGTVLVLGLAGNGFICCAFVRNKNMRSLPNYIILNLAITDLILVVDMIVWIVLLVVWRRMDRSLYNMFVSIDVMCMSSAMLNLGLISIDRYLAVVLPLRHPSLLIKSRIRRYVAAVWCFAFILGVVSFSRTFVKDRLFNNLFTTFLAVVVYGIPAFSIVFAYTKVFIAARRQLRWISFHMRIHTNKRESSKRETRLAFNILIIVLPFVSTYGVYFGVTMCEMYYEQCIYQIPEKVSFFVSYLPHIVAAIDPIIYILVTKDYRVALRKLFKCDRHNDHVSPRTIIEHKNACHLNDQSEVVRNGVTTPISGGTMHFDFPTKYPQITSGMNGACVAESICDTKL